MQQNLIQANKDPKILIKEKNRYFWHVEQTRRDVKPGTDGTNIRTTTVVKPYSNAMYTFLFEPEKRKGRRKLAFKGGLNLLPACGIREARVVHDPYLQMEMDNAAKTEESAFAKRMAEAKAAKAAKVDDDMAEGDSASGPGADDTGTAKRPRRKTN